MAVRIIGGEVVSEAACQGTHSSNARTRGSASGRLAPPLRMQPVLTRTSSLDSCARRWDCVLSLCLVSRRNSQSQAGTPVMGASASAVGSGMAPLSLGSTPLVSSALAPHSHSHSHPLHSPLSPASGHHTPALSLHPSSAQTSGNSSLASTPSLHSTALPSARERGTSPALTPARERGTSPALTPARERGTSPALTPARERGTSPASMAHHRLATPPPLALGAGPHPHPAAAPSSAQFTNPYLSHTGFGGPGVPSGPFNDAGVAGGGGAEADAAYAAAAAHHSAAFSAARAAAEAAVASYYPYHMLQGFLGPGFILGPHPNMQPSPQPLYASESDPSAASAAGSPDLSTEGESQQSVQTQAQQLQHRSLSSPPHAGGGHALPLSGTSSTSSSSCPSPLLTSTIERRRSKPHIQFVPPTHAVAPGGLVLPLIPPPPAAVTAPASSTSARVSHAFNLFGLPPVFVYEIRVPPHVYLLTALILYFIGPPALIPLVATFFFYRWHLQNQASSASAASAATTQMQQMQRAAQHQGITHRQPAPGGLTPSKPLGGGGGGGGHPSGLPKAQHPSPSLGPSRRHPNIHSLSDL